MIYDIILPFLLVLPVIIAIDKGQILVALGRFMMINAGIFFVILNHNLAAYKFLLIGVSVLSIFIFSRRNISID